MARTNVPVDAVTTAGVVAAGTGVSEITGNSTDDHEFANDGQVMLQVRNSSATPYDVIFITQGTIDGCAIADKTIEVPATSAMVFGPFPKTIYNTAAGKVEFDVENNALMLKAYHL